MKTLFFYFVHSSKKRLILLQIDYFSTKPSIFVQIFREILAKSIFEGSNFAGNLFILKESLFSYFKLSFLSKSEKNSDCTFYLSK